jgi:hypothetical protein
MRCQKIIHIIIYRYMKNSIRFGSKCTKIGTIHEECMCVCARTGVLCVRACVIPCYVTFLSVYACPFLLQINFLLHVNVR